VVEVTPAPPAPSGPHSLPARPAFDVFTGASLPVNPTFAGSNSDVVTNRAALRLANLSAADAMRAELAGAAPLKATSRATLLGDKPTPQSEPAPVQDTPPTENAVTNSEMEVDGQNPVVQEEPSTSDKPEAAATPELVQDVEPIEESVGTAEASVRELIASAAREVAGDADKPHGVKRSATDMEKDEDAVVEEEEPVKPALRVNADGTVDQEDTVKCVFYFWSRSAPTH
jgi:5'-3' exoribonuclease 2